MMSSPVVKGSLEETLGQQAGVVDHRGDALLAAAKARTSIWSRQRGIELAARAALWRLAAVPRRCAS